MGNEEKSLKTNEEKEKKRNKEAYSHFFESVRNALVDLTTLEVNSVLVSNISAEHPTKDSEFLNQTCEDLVEWFESHILEDKIQLSLRDNSLAQLRELCAQNKRTEDKDKDKAKEIIQGLRDDVNECFEHEPDKILTEKQMRERSEYRRHLRYLHKYLYLQEQWVDNNEFTSRERQQLRKLWELVPTTFVYAQTVIQLDGDIISRINDQLFSAARGNAEELMRLHKWNVEAGVNYRNGLMSTFVQILRSALGR
ncbi:MAG: hypothetical protein IBX41_04775 [Methanophagales archaeon]|nr:hypothetical protein [Methanophagales archaeon]